MQRDYYEPMDPKPINEGGEVPHGQTGTSREGHQDGAEGQGMRERAGEMGERAREQASNVATQAQERADQGVDRAAEGMHTAAERVRERAAQQGGMQAQVGTKVADGLERSAGYLRERDTAQIWDDLEQFVKDKPVQAAVGALFAGFVIGRILR